MVTQEMTTPDLYFDTIWGFQRSAALKSALDLELFTVIDRGAATVADIAAACGASERGIRILCDYLATIDLLTKSGDRYSLPPMSATFLTKRSPAYLGTTAAFLYSPDLIRGFDGLTDTIRRGTVAAAENNDALAPDHPMWVGFARAMVPMMMPAAQEIAQIVGARAGGPMRVLDIAAGHGIFGIVVAQQNPQAEVVAVDWAPVLAVATENATAMGVGDRHRTLPGSAFTVDYGRGFDVALVTNFLHHFDVPTNVGLLRKVAAALRPGGRVVILEFVPDENRLTPPMAARFSLQMLAGTPSGDAYTLSELTKMLTDAGFTDVTAHPLHGPQTVLVATR